jgi:hypothetical protein
VARVDAVGLESREVDDLGSNGLGVAESFEQEVKPRATSMRSPASDGTARL